MAGFTNRSKFKIFQWIFRQTEALPTSFKVALVTNATPPAATTNILTDLVEIAAGNGYTAGGESLTPGAVDFDALTEDDGNNWATMQIKDVEWTASGGSIPASGDAARWAVLLDTNDNVLAYWDLATDRVAADGQVLRLIDLEMRGKEVA